MKQRTFSRLDFGVFVPILKMDRILRMKSPTFLIGCIAALLLASMPLISGGGGGACVLPGIAVQHIEATCGCGGQCGCGRLSPLPAAPVQAPSQSAQTPVGPAVTALGDLVCFSPSVEDAAATFCDGAAPFDKPPIYLLTCHFRT